MGPELGIRQRAAISLLAPVVGICIPFVQLYLLNISMLTLPLSVHLPWIATLCLILAAAFFALQGFVPARARRLTSCVLLFVGVMAWAEGTLLVGDFGFLQGGDLDWAKARALLYYELVIVLIFLLAVAITRSAIVERSLEISIALTISALVGLYPAWSASRSLSNGELAHTFTQDGILSLSKNQNVIVYVMDTYQSDVFAEIVADSPKWRDELAGFVYFPDATSAFCHTYASIPNMLSGDMYDNTRPFPEYLRESLLTHSLPSVLKERGFDSRFHSFSPFVLHPHPDIADNLSEIESAAGRRWQQGREFFQLLNLTIFRISPYLAKPWAFNENEFRLQGRISFLKLPEAYPLPDELRSSSAGNGLDDLEFHDRAMNYLSAEREEPAFRLFHLHAVHAPYVLDQELRYVGKQPINRTNVRNQAEGMLKLLSEEFERLREIGAFDNSLIFVVGDHGAGEFPAVGVDYESLGELGLPIQRIGDSRRPSSRKVQGGIPLVLVKPMGSKEPFRVSPAQVELGDVANTAFHELGLSSAAHGPSMFHIPPDSIRARSHGCYEWSGWGRDYLVPMTDHLVSGFSWDSESWSPSGRDMNRNAIRAVEGTLVVLGPDGNLSEFTHAGWSEPETRGRRIVDGRSSIALPPRARSGGSTLRFRTWWREDEEQESNTLRVLVNEESVGVYPMHRGANTELAASVPAELCEDGSELVVSFQLEDKDGAMPLLMELRELAPAAAGAR